MATIEELRARFTAQADGLKSVIGSVRKDLVGIGDDTEDSTKRANKGFSSLQGSLKDLEKALGTTLDGEEFKDLQDAMKKAQKELEETGEVGEKAMKELTAAADKAQTQLGTVGAEGRESLKQVQAAVAKVDSDLKNLGKDTGLDNVKDDIDGVSDSLANVGASENVGGIGSVFMMFGKVRLAAVAAVGAIAGVTLGLFKMGQQGDELQKSLNTLQVQTGATEEEMKGMEESLINIYENNYGESFEDIASSMALVKQATGETGKALEDATVKALLLRDSFGFEVNESLKVARVMMDQFGISADQAFTLIAQGQQKGLNVSDDMLDSFWEYSVYFKQLGFDAENMWDVFKSGADAGAFNMDKVGDAVKEFGIRIKDGSKATGDALSFLFRSDDFDNYIAKLQSGGTKTKEFMELAKKVGSENAAALVQDLNKTGAASEKAFKSIEFTMGASGKFLDDISTGVLTGKDAMQQIIQKIKEIEDPMTQTQMGVALFGTQWEDLETKTMLALGTVRKEADMTADTLGKMDQVKYNSVGEAIAGIGRQIAGNILIPLEKKAMPGINKFVNNAKTAFSGFIKLMQGDMVGFQDTITKGFGQEKGLAIIKFFMKIKDVVQNMIPVWLTVFNGIKSIVVQILSYVSPYIMSIIGSITKWWKENGSELLANVQTVWKGIFAVIQFFMPLIKFIIGSVFSAIKGTIMGALKFIGGLFKFFAGLFTGDFGKMWQGIKEMFVGAIQFIWNFMQLLFFGKILSIFKNLVTGGIGLIKNFWKYIVDGFKNFGSAIGTAVKNLGTAILSRFKAAWDGVVKTFQFFRNTGLGIIKSFRATMQVLVEGMRQRILSIFTKLYLTAVKVFKSLVTGVINAGKGLYNGIKNIFTNTFNTLKGLNDKMKANMISAWTTVKNKAVEIFNAMKTTISKVFTGIVDGAKALPGKIGSGIKSMAGKVADGIKKLVNKMNEGVGKGVNGVIGGVNWVLDKIGVDSKVPKWSPPEYAKGTNYHPGGPAIVGEKGRELIHANGQTMLADGEQLINLPRGASVLPNKQTEALLSGLPAYAGGVGDFIKDTGKRAWEGTKRIADKTRDAAVDVGGKLKDFGLDVWDYMSDPKALMKKVFDKIGVGFPPMDGGFGKIGKGIIDYIKTKATSFVGKKMDDTGGFDTKNVPGNVRKWIKAAIEATGVPSSWLGGLTTIAMKESGGNPKAMNNWDSNAKKGTPSMGLMQTIRPTFDAHKMKGHGNILNPIDNAIAAIRYIKSRYGNIMNVPGLKSMSQGGPYKGYFEGARVAAKQLAWIAEKGAEYVIPTDGSTRAHELWRQAGAENGFTNPEAFGAQATAILADMLREIKRMDPSPVLVMDSDVVAHKIHDKVSQYQNAQKKTINSFTGNGVVL
ncbi:phage tail tape measure protein [Fictibacillus aquaticus]|uniref:Transglycosylase SLT domain-containing protein n=1 Tax=Fictibacillus aquaticus TaxID=2021314 RepID=A0A235FAW5_9BACL|nr:phage tail tape measure protein [Fictibacillus aquaticus]OYD58480.1 hypothetical protein CGZ90_00845 [Fictibacillus aquaticus]